jgi:hypothetical protein
MNKETTSDFELFQSEVITFVDFIENTISRMDKLMDRVDEKIKSIDEKNKIY